MNRTLSVVLSTVLLALTAAEASAHGRHYSRHQPNHHRHPHSDNYSHHYSHHHRKNRHSGWYPNVAFSWGLAQPYAHRYPYPYTFADVYPLYPAPYGYSPGVTAVVVEPEPQVYIERQRLPDSETAAGGPPPLWFYCSDPAGYYPHVPHCRQRWITVDPATLAEPSGAPR